MLKVKILNFSGHELPNNPNEDRYEIIDIPIPNIDISSVGNLISEMKEIMKKTIEKCGSDIEKGNIEVILPGFSPLAGVILAMIHGYGGHFPIIRYTYRIEHGFELSDKLNLQDIRLEYRDARFRQ